MSAPALPHGRRSLVFVLCAVLVVAASCSRDEIAAPPPRGVPRPGTRPAADIISSTAAPLGTGIVGSLGPAYNLANARVNATGDVAGMVFSSPYGAWRTRAGVLEAMMSDGAWTAVSFGGLADDGTVVGNRHSAADYSISHGFRWHADGSVEDLGPPSPCTNAMTVGTEGVRHNALSRNGHIVGYAGWNDGCPSGNTYAHVLRWTDGTGWVDLGAPPGAKFLGLSSTPAGISDTGLIAVRLDQGNGKYHVGLWTPRDGMQDLGVPPGSDGSDLSVTDVNDAGQVVGIWRGQGWLWTPGQGYSFPASGGGSYLDNAGQIAGLVWTTVSVPFRGSISGFVPTRWETDGSMSQPTSAKLPDGTVLSPAYFTGAELMGFGPHGELLGSVDFRNADLSQSWSRVPFVYSGGGTLTVLDNFGADIVRSTDINDAGVIAGMADQNGYNVPVRWVLTPPASKPVVTVSVSGTQGSDHWYTSDVSISWKVSTGGAAITASSGCAPIALTTDTPGTTFTCTVTTAGGTTAQSVSVKRDATPPVISFAGNAGTYTVDQAVAITCSAVDATSGIATAACPGVNAAAYTFPLGTTTLNASAADVAGNGSTASTSFVVQVTAAALGNLTVKLCTNSGVASALVAKLKAAAAAQGRGDVTAAHNQLDAYANQVRAQAGKSIAAADAATLIRLAQALY